MSEIFSMTNSTKTIELDGTIYILRIPGIGTSELIDRHQEHEVYKTIAKYNISDKVLYFDDNSGIKIAKYIENCHNCNSKNIEEVKAAMTAIKHLHSLNLKVNFEFDLKQKIDFYESLMTKSKYEDYGRVKLDIMLLLKSLDSLNIKKCLCHIDPNQDNILLDNKTNEVKAIVDWEYAAMQDPIIDIAMFCIYAGYDKKEIDSTLSIYFDGKEVSNEIKARYYIYIASCGLLWSNWCEYKNQLGQSFGGIYEQSQYNYAKIFSKLAKELIK